MYIGTRLEYRHTVEVEKHTNWSHLLRWVDFVVFRTGEISQKGKCIDWNNNTTYHKQALRTLQSTQTKFSFMVVWSSKKKNKKKMIIEYRMEMVLTAVGSNTPSFPYVSQLTAL